MTLNSLHLRRNPLAFPNQIDHKKGSTRVLGSKLNDPEFNVYSPAERLL